MPALLGGVRLEGAAEVPLARELHLELKHLITPLLQVLIEYDYMLLWGLVVSSLGHLDDLGVVEGAPVCVLQHPLE